MSVLLTIIYICGVLFLVNLAWNVISVLIKKGRPYKQFKYNMYLNDKKEVKRLINKVLDRLETDPDTLVSEKVKKFRKEYTANIIKNFETEFKP